VIAGTLVHGIILGLVYGVLAAGLVVVYRASGVVNFAYGETGALGAAILAKLVIDERWPWLAALPVVLALGGAIGALTEVVIARRLANRPRLALLVATIGLSQVLLVAEIELPAIRRVAPFPSLLSRQLSIGSVVLTGPDFVAIAAVPAIVVGLAVWLTGTPSGRALRASADNPDAARLAGIRPTRVTLLAWTLAGVVSTAAAIIADPLQGVTVGQQTEAIGAGLLVRALVAALVGRLESLPLAIAGGVGVGLVQAFADAGHISQSLVDLILLVAVLVLVLVRPSRSSDDDGAGHLVAVPPLRVGRRRLLAGVRLWAVLVLGAVVVVPLVAGRSSQLFLLSHMALYAIVGLSVVVLTGWGGQLSLGQFAVVGVGTFGAAALESHGVPFWLTVPLAGLLGAGVSLLVGLPALRARGLDLAVTTLALAVACSSWLFTQSWLLETGGVALANRGKLAMLDLRGPLAYYEVCLLTLGVALVGVSAVRRSDLGRRLLAVRANERRSAAAGVSPARAKLTAFVLAGVLAGVAGALLAGLRVRSGAADFGPDQSLQIVALAVIGGAGSALGAVVGAVVVLGIPAIFGDNTIAGLLPSGIGLLILVLAVPGGLLEVGDRLGRLVARGGPTDVGPAGGPAGGLAEPGPIRGRAAAVAGSTLALDVRDLRVRYGGRVALDGVDLGVGAGEVVGLIGANGAGKSTLLDVVSGFIIPDGGTIVLAGRTLAGLSPAQRARAGVGRTLQDASLFDGLTVREAVLVSTPGAATDRRERVSRTLELLALSGLADAPCQHLSTGTRRRVEMACAVAGSPSLLLLDEPTAGLSRVESEGFAPLIQHLQTEVGAAVVLVEHDIALVASVADRIVCLGAGRVIASGPPDEVLADPAVVESVLGTSELTLAPEAADEQPRSDEGDGGEDEHDNISAREGEG